MLDILPALAALALSAFTSATILPGTSEVLLLSLAAGPVAPLWQLLLVASAANTAGSCVNWLRGRALALGYGGGTGVTPAQRARAEVWFGRWGKWTLLLSWVPIVGDPLTLVAGLMRVPFPLFLAIVAVAKTGRYAVLLLAAAQF